MAKITVTIEGSEIGTATVVTELDQANSDRLVAYLMAQHGTDPAGNPRDLAGMVRAYWNGVAAGTAINVERWEKEQAAKAAEQGVAPLAMSITTPEPEPTPGA